MNKKNLDPLKEWSKAMAKKFKNSRSDCPMLLASLHFPDSGFAPPKIDILDIGSDGKCQCKECLKMRNKIDAIIVKALYP